MKKTIKAALDAALSEMNVQWVDIRDGKPPRHVPRSGDIATDPVNRTIYTLPPRNTQWASNIFHELGHLVIAWRKSDDPRKQRHEIRYGNDTEVCRVALELARKCNAPDSILEYLQRDLDDQLKREAKS